MKYLITRYLIKSDLFKRCFIVAACFTMSTSFSLFSSSSLFPSAWATQAQPVPIPEEASLSPQLNISGVGVVTSAYGRSAQQEKAQGGVDYSDTTLQIGAAQRLYHSGVGSMGFGLLTLGSDSSSGTSLFLAQAFLDYQSEKVEVLLGRSDNPAAHLVDFPTLRDDDLFTLTNPLNPFSNGSVAQDHRYSNGAGVTLNQGLKFFENFHVQQLITTGGMVPYSGLNSFGATFQYLGTPGLEAFTRFPSLGFGVEHVTSLGAASGGLYQFYGGGVVNLNESVTDRWDLRVLEVVSLGSDLRSFGTVRETYEADSHAIAAALRYLHSPFGKPGLQVALTAAYKDYTKVDRASTAGFALTGIKRLGEGFDLAVQYQGQWRDQALSGVQASGLTFEQIGQVGFVFNWDATFNRHLSPRRSILNQQYQYVPN